MSGEFTRTMQLKLRPYCEWPPCDGHPRLAVWPELLKILQRGTITVYIDAVENNGQRGAGNVFAPFPKCDSPLFWAIAEPELRGWICQHCVEVN